MKLPTIKLPSLKKVVQEGSVLVLGGAGVYVSVNIHSTTLQTFEGLLLVFFLLYHIFEK